MTELEKIERAKIYMDKLANGINPINDTMASEEDVINNVRLARCFFFVSDVLRRIIENGGITSSVADKEIKKLPLSIPFEKRSRFDYSEKPISASDFAKRVNALVDTENMKKLTYSGILSWLTEIGMMEWVLEANGKRVKRPTQFGKEIGISVENRIRDTGSYQVVVYDRQAQCFMIDNLDAIVAAENRQAKMQAAPWTREQDACLITLYRKSIPMGEIAMALRRSTSAVRSRLKRLGVMDKK